MLALRFDSERFELGSQPFGALVFLLGALAFLLGLLVLRLSALAFLLSAQMLPLYRGRNPHTVRVVEA